MGVGGLGEKVIAQETHGTAHITQRFIYSYTENISKVTSDLVIECLSIVHKIGII